MDICDWLREYLKKGPAEVNEIRSAARTAGYTLRDLREAKLICRIRTTNNGSRLCKADRWFWQLPEDEE